MQHTPESYDLQFQIMLGDENGTVANLMVTLHGKINTAV
jgi:hypothetical protein